MFPLHEATQRRICRLAFAAGCLLPTCVLAGAGIWLRSPLHRAAQAKEYSTAAGVQITLASLIHPQPGRMRLTDVVVEDDGHVVAQADQVEIDRGDEITINLRRVSAAGNSLGVLLERLQNHILRRVSGQDTIHLQCDHIILAGQHADTQTLTDVRLTLQPRGEERIVTADYRIAGIEMRDPARLRVVRRRLGVQHTTEIQWRTGEASLPLAPWAEQFPRLLALGDRSRFCGTVTAHQTDGKWTGDLNGKMEGVDLERLVSQQFPHKLSGSAQVEIHEAQFQAGRLTRARGRFVAGPGVLGNSLVEAASKQWKCEINSTDEKEMAEADLHRYTRLSFEFELKEAQLHLHGTCPDAPKSTILKLNDNRHLIIEKDARSTLSLIRILSPDDENSVPATSSTWTLLRWLPLPEENHSANDAFPRAHVKRLDK